VYSIRCVGTSNPAQKTKANAAASGRSQSLMTSP
jgi:hypothetical protein